MRWSVSLTAEGDRELTREEIVELADAVAPYLGVATGIGTTAYGAQLVVEAEDREEAVALARAAFAEAAAAAGLPAWPIAAAETLSELEDEMDDLDIAFPGAP
jgi:hypothetical protein